jgi:hypothetical protein
MPTLWTAAAGALTAGWDELRLTRRVLAPTFLAVILLSAIMLGLWLLQRSLLPEPPRPIPEHSIPRLAQKNRESVNLLKLKKDAGNRFFNRCSWRRIRNSLATPSWKFFTSTFFATTWRNGSSSDHCLDSFGVIFFEPFDDSQRSSWIAGAHKRDGE